MIDGPVGTSSKNKRYGELQNNQGGHCKRVEQSEKSTNPHRIKRIDTCDISSSKKSNEDKSDLV